MVGPMQDLLNRKTAVLAAQRKRGIVSLQEPSRKLVNAHIKSLTVAATKGATANRFRLYESYCVENSIPVFPIVGEVVFLHLHSISNGSATSGPAYDSHTSVLNTLRREILPLWENQLDCKSVSISVTVEPAVKEFCATARASAFEKKMERIKREEEEELARSTGGGSAARRNARGSARKEGGSSTNLLVEPVSATPTRSRKRGLESSPAPSTTTMTPSKATTSNSQIPTPSRASKRPAVSSTTPNSNGNNKRRKVEESNIAISAPTSTSVRKTIKLKASAVKPISALDTVPTTTPKKKRGRPFNVDRPSPALVPTPARAPIVATASTSNRSTRRNNKLALEEKDAAMAVDNAVEEITENGVHGIGMFGKIIRFFGFGQ